MDWETQKRIQERNNKFLFHRYGKELAEVYFKAFQNVDEASAADKKAFTMALEKIARFDENPQKNWTELVILLSAHPNINHLYFTDEKNQKHGPATFALDRGQLHVATLFIDGQDTDAREEALENTEREAITEGARAWVDFNEAWKEPAFPRNDTQKYMLLAMYGAKSKGFGLSDTEGNPEDIPAFLVKRYALNPHQKITLPVNDTSVTDTPFMYAMEMANEENRTIKIPTFESGFYKNADLTFSNVFGRPIGIVSVFHSPQVSAKLLGSIPVPARVKTEERKEIPVPPQATPASDSLEHPDLFDFANAARQKGY